jgi:hypothetical protein
MRQEFREARPLWRVLLFWVSHSPEGCESDAAPRRVMVKPSPAFADSSIVLAECRNGDWISGSFQAR